VRLSRTPLGGWSLWLEHPCVEIAAQGRWHFPAALSFGSGRLGPYGIIPQGELQACGKLPSLAQAAVWGCGAGVRSRSTDSRLIGS
jgi:hypothetical protein